MALGDVALGVGARVVEPAQDVDAVRAVGDVVVEVREQREPSPSPRAEVDVELGEHVDDDRVERVGEAVEGDRRIHEEVDDDVIADVHRGQLVEQRDAKVREGGVALERRHHLHDLSQREVGGHREARDRT